MITSGGIDVDQILEYDSNLTLEDLKSYLVDIFFDRDDQASNQCFKGAQERHIVAYHCCGHTGQLQEIPYMGDRVEGTTCAGCQMFHEALAKEASSFLTLDTQFTNKKKYGD